MGRPAWWMKKLTGREPMKSPGAPSHLKEIERRIWAEIRTGAPANRQPQPLGYLRR